MSGAGRLEHILSKLAGERLGRALEVAQLSLTKAFGHEDEVDVRRVRRAFRRGEFCRGDLREQVSELLVARFPTEFSKDDGLCRRCFGRARERVIALLRIEATGRHRE